MKEIVLAVDVVVEPDDPGYHAYAPAFKGLHVDGDTVEEALENARDAIALYIQDMIECGEPIPVGVKLEPATKVRESRAVYRTENLKLVLAKH